MIVGLGNYGAEYDYTPHNVGFATVDMLANKLGLTISKKKCKGLIAEGTINGENVLLVKPLTYMNNSGDCVFDLAKKYNIITRNICVILDDVDLTAGLCRIRPSGSSGTHNGLKSVTARLGTTEFTRIRIGVDTPAREGDLADFVLRRMPIELRGYVSVGVENAVNYALAFINGENVSDTK